MGKKYLDTKEGTLESSILGVWRDAVGVQEEDNPSSRVDARTKSYREHRAKLEAARIKREQKKLDPVNKKAVMKKFDDRKDRDIDNDGDVDSTDKYLHKRRQAISKAIKKEEVELDEETIIDKVKDIVKRKSAAKIDGVTVDLFTASAISQIYDKVNPMNKKKMEKLPIKKLASAAMKVMQKNEYVPEDMTVTASTDGGISQRDLDYVQKELRKLGIRDAVVDQNEMDSNKIDVKTKMSDDKVKKAFDKSKMTVTYESARRDAMRAMRKDKEVDPADIDDIATDDDVKAASKNIIMQLRKSVSLRGNFPVEFMDKKKVKVDAKIAAAVQDKYNSIRKASDKQKFTIKIAKSYKDMLSALKEEVVKEGTWALPDTPKLKAGLKKLMMKKIPLGKDGETAIDKIGDYIGDDGLYDDLYTASKKDGEKADARPLIRGWMDREFVDSWKKYRIESRTILERIDNKIQARKNG